MPPIARSAFTRRNPTSSVIVPKTGLTFPSNGGSPSGVVVAFRWVTPPAIQPITVLLKALPIQQNSYHSFFFFGPCDSNFVTGPTNGTLPTGGTYWGAHPYPTAGAGGADHKWEVATNGQDFYVDANGNNTDVADGIWHRQASVARNSPDILIDYYWDLGTSDLRKIAVSQPGFQLTPHPNTPGLIVGDSPWALLAERGSFTMRGMQVYTAALSLAHINELSPLDNDAAVAAKITELGLTSSIWYHNINPTPGDISDKSGKGNNPVWVTGTTATLWEE